MKISIKWEDRIGPILYINIKNIIFGFCLCHRKKERSFHFLGLENFLCSRCLGILIGGIIGFIVRFLGFFLPFIWSVIFLLPLISDGLLQAFSVKPSNNSLRFITGLLCGFGIVFIGDCFGEFIKQISLSKLF